MRNGKNAACLSSLPRLTVTYREMSREGRRHLRASARGVCLAAVLLLSAAICVNFNLYGRTEPNIALLEEASLFPALIASCSRRCGSTGHDVADLGRNRCPFEFIPVVGRSLGFHF